MLPHNTLILLCFFFLHEDSPGWDSGRSNGFVNGYHDNRANGGFGGRGPPRNDRGGRGAYRGNRGGGTFNQPLQNAGGEILLCLTYLTLAAVSVVLDVILTILEL